MIITFTISSFELGFESVVLNSASLPSGTSTFPVVESILLPLKLPGISGLSFSSFGRLDESTGSIGEGVFGLDGSNIGLSSSSVIIPIALDVVLFISTLIVNSSSPS
ncbi:MAG: hypothetical protein ACOX39_04650 [Arcobacteraceae bacterium]